MKFEKVLQLIISEFGKADVRYALMGGFAMGLLGVMRATTDLDFLVADKDILKIEKVMDKYGYKCVYKTKNVSQYVSDMEFFGEIDFLHAFRERSLSMLKRAKEVPVFRDAVKIKVLNAEDIIGLKTQAMVNDESRRIREYADIEDIIRCYKGKLDWELIKEYFYLFNMKSAYRELKEKHG